MSRERAHRSWRSAERVKRLSDRLIGIGPFGIGLDGVLTWVPVAGMVYTLAAAGLLLYEAVAARASPRTLAKMAVYLAADAATTEIPLIGDLIDLVFTGHLLAAKALQADIEARHGPGELAAWPVGKRARPVVPGATGEG